MSIQLSTSPRICRLTYTHLDYLDVFNIYKEQMSLLFPLPIKHYIASNTCVDSYIQGSYYVEYDNNNTYPSRLLQVLEKLADYEFIFFDHEDMFLYAEPDASKLEAYYRQMCDGNFDYIRLIKGGNCSFTPVPSCPTLYSISPRSRWIFSIQPSFWRRSTLITLLKKNLTVNIWELETRSQAVSRQIQLKAAFSYRAGQRRGLHHFDNDVYPYVATAIGKGKWNLGEYGKELEPLLVQHHIDPTARGWF